MNAVRRFALAALTLAVVAAPARAASPEQAAEANAEGAALFRSGKVAAAAGKFEEALALDPGLAAAPRNLAVALATLAQEQLRAGDFDAARRHLERATELAPREAPYLLLLGALHLRRGELYPARRLLDRALELAPQLAAARELSGDLYYQEGSLERARADWVAARDAGAPGVRAKLERLERETGAAGGFGRDVSRHFTIEYDGPVPAAVARTALRLLEEAYDRLWREFGRAPQHDLPVILYSRTLFEQITRSPSWVAGTFDGKIRVPVGGLRDAAEAAQLAPILAHELTHAFIRANVPGQLPLWFEEGLARYLESGPGGAAHPARPAVGGPFASLEELNGALRDGPRIESAYDAAALAVAEMVRQDGFWLPRRILEKAAAGLSFPEAFRAAAGIELESFEKRWVRLQRP